VPNPLRQVRGILLLVYLAGMMVVFASRKLRSEWAVRPIVHLWVVGSLVLLILDSGTRTLYLLHLLPWIAAMLAAGFGWVWVQNPRVRPVLGAVAVVFLVIQVGGIAYGVKRNEWSRVYRPVAHYLQERLKPGDLVMGGPEWGFAIGFGPQLMDDTCLGYFSKKVPSYLVIDPRYRAQFDWYRTNQPDIYRFVQNRVQNEYRLVNQVDAVDIYQLRSDRASASR